MSDMDPLFPKWLKDFVQSFFIAVFCFLIAALVWIVITQYIVPVIDRKAEERANKVVEPLCMETLDACMDTTDRCIETTESCIETLTEDRQSRQRRIFKWEICSMFDNCWSCVYQTGVENQQAGDIEHCFTHACDGVTDGFCSGLLEDMLRQYFEAPVIKGPVG